MKRGWFGPKAFGWGVSPASWEGWLATAVMILAMIGAGLIIDPADRALVWTARGFIIAVYLAVVAFTCRSDARTSL